MSQLAVCRWQLAEIGFQAKYKGIHLVFSSSNNGFTIVVILFRPLSTFHFPSFTFYPLSPIT
jgi:hypothetical protein